MLSRFSEIPQWGSRWQSRALSPRSVASEPLDMIAFLQGNEGGSMTPVTRELRAKEMGNKCKKMNKISSSNLFGISFGAWSIFSWQEWLSSSAGAPGFILRVLLIPPSLLRRQPEPVDTPLPPRLPSLGSLASSSHSNNKPLGQALSMFYLI